MQNNELIRLDAQLVDMIDHAVFTAELPNGHRFVAVGKNGQWKEFGDEKPPCEVRVEISPYDMSRGHIISGYPGALKGASQ